MAKSALIVAFACHISATFANLSVGAEHRRIYTMIFLIGMATVAALDLAVFGKDTETAEAPESAY